MHSIKSMQGGRSRRPCEKECSQHSLKGCQQATQPASHHGLLPAANSRRDLLPCHNPQCSPCPSNCSAEAAPSFAPQELTSGARYSSVPTMCRL